MVYYNLGGLLLRQIRMKQVTTEATKTKVPAAIAVGTLLVVIGAAFGAVVFNGLVPNVFVPSNSTTVSAALPPQDSSLEKWYLAFDSKITSTSAFSNFNELINSSVNLWKSNVKVSASFVSGDVSINAPTGAETNIVLKCEGLELYTINNAKTLVCTTNYMAFPQSGSADSKFSATAVLTFDLKTNKLAFNNMMLKVIKVDQAGNVTSVRETSVTPSWWVR